MRHATAPSSRLRSLPLMVGAFLSLLFLCLGIVGSFTTVPPLRKWSAAASWERVPGTVLTAGILPASGRTIRSEFTWEYEYGGLVRKGRGDGLTGITSSDREGAERLVAEHPPGSPVTVLVNPDNPDESAFRREPAGHLLVLLVPPFFAVLGLTGAFLIIAGALGWLGNLEKSALVRFFAKRGVILTLVFVAFAVATGGLILYSMRSGNAVGLIFAGILGWGLYSALKAKGKNREKR